MKIRDYKIVLASSSPRRIEMLKTQGLDPIIIHPDSDENMRDENNPENMVKKLALRKAKSVEAAVKTRFSHEPCIIIGADTVVFLDDIIGKPKNRADAYRILNYLNGKEHYVATGVALLNTKTEGQIVFHEITKVGFKNYSDDDIWAYIDTEEPYDKAGGYAIQGGWGKNIAYISGDYNNVVGFPWDRIKRELNKIIE